MKKTVVIIKGTSMGRTTFLVGESLQDMFKKDLGNRRYHAVPAPSFDVKPRKKPPNFARFQNDFSNRRSHKKL